MSPAAVDKMNYIVSALCRCGNHVELISCGMSAPAREPASVEETGDGIMVPGNWTTALKKFVNMIEC